VASATHHNPAAVAGGYEKLTARQQQMMDVLDRGDAAWRSGDGAAVAALFTPDAVLVDPSGTFSLATLAAGVPTGGIELERLAPIVFNDNIATVVERYPQGPSTEVFRFTTTGDVKITQYTAMAPGPFVGLGSGSSVPVHHDW
jgi:hypothetical protein